MTEDHRRVVSESIFVNVKVGTADATVAHLDFYLIVATARFFSLPQFDVPDSRLIFNQGFDYLHLQISRIKAPNVSRSSLNYERLSGREGWLAPAQLLLESCFELDSDHASEILSAAEGTLKWINVTHASVHVLLNDGPFRITTGSHILNDLIEINCPGAEFAEYSAPYCLEKTDPVSTSGFQDW